MNFKGREGGFTLIEMMITVAIIGILASTAFPAYQGYIRKSRCVEAVHALRKISEGVLAYHAAKGILPATRCSKSRRWCVGRGKAPRQHPRRACRRSGTGVYPGKWVKKAFNRAPWTSILFAPEGDSRFQYRYYGYTRGSRRVYGYVDALGDPLCTKRYTRYRVYFRLQDGAVRASGIAKLQ